MSNNTNDIVAIALICFVSQMVDFEPAYGKLFMTSAFFVYLGTQQVIYIASKAVIL